MQTHTLSGRTVCIVDDDELVRSYIAAQLRHYTIEVFEAANSAQLFALMQTNQIDCILMDITLAPENGLFVQAQLRQKFVNAPPIIMLSASDDQRTIIKAFRTGVADYLVKKGLRTEELLQSLQNAVGRRAENDASREELERLKSNSVFDAFTGFYRRDAMEEMLATDAEAAIGSRKTFAVLLIRVNQFDRVVEKSGQLIGQQLIRAFSTRLRGALRKVDVCGRFDANTFINHISVTANRREVEALVQRLEQALTFDLELESMRLGVSASFGSAIFPEDATDPVGLVRFAEDELNRVYGELDAKDRSEDGVLPARSARTGDRRASPRHRVFKQGTIIVDGGKSTVDCTVRDLSETGASVRLGGIYSVPPSFDLVIAGSAARAAQRVWQNGNSVGIMFAGDPRFVTGRR